MKQASRLAAIVLGVICLLAVSMPAVAQNATGKANVETQQYNDWQTRCLQTQTGQRCRMTQVVNNPNSSTPIMRVIMEYPPQLDSAAMAFRLPLGTRLPPGLRISVDGRQPIRIPFQVCQKNGCQASLRVDDALLSQFKQGTSFIVTINGPRGKKISLDVSLMGFTAANDAIAE